jgi:hypothetical protein
MTVLVLAACGNERADERTTDGAPPAADAGSAPTGSAIPIELWVDELVENHTTDQAQPDTVDDKNIENTEDPSAFDHLLR